MKKLFYLFIMAIVFLHSGVGYGGMIVGGDYAVSGGTDYTQDSNCVGAWYMSGLASADEIDRSGNSSTLTRYKTDDWRNNTETTFVDGFSGSCRDTHYQGNDSGFDSAVGLATDLSGSGATISIFCRTKPVLLNTGADNCIMAIQDRFEFTIDSSGNLRAQVRNEASTTVNLTYGNTISNGDELALGLTYDGTTAKFYVDGTLVDSEAQSGGLDTNSETFFIGARDANNTKYRGQVDEVIMFDVGVSSTYALGIYTNGIDGTKGASG